MDFMRNVVFDAAKTTIYGPPGAPEDANAQATASTRHPVAFMFHLLFKCSALALYFFGSLFGMNVTVMYVTTILLLAFDFWTVKVLLRPPHSYALCSAHLTHFPRHPQNVTGRLLVGLRWWNEVREDGGNDWKFESPEDLPPDQRPVVAAQDSRMFWITMWVTPLIWSLILISNILSPLK
jgi:hypothetical protein